MTKYQFVGERILHQIEDLVEITYNLVLNSVSKQKGWTLNTRSTREQVLDFDLIKFRRINIRIIVQNRAKIFWL